MVLSLPSSPRAGAWSKSSRFTLSTYACSTATQLVSGEINSVDEYKPYSVGNKVYATLEESIADLKNPDKDGTCTPDMFLIALDGLIDRFRRDFAWYSEPECAAVFPLISEEQFAIVKKRTATVTSALDGLVAEIERRLQNE